jgi:hypothetical protein
LMQLESDMALPLLGSFRFGANIANIADCILFTKEMSGQTSQLYCPEARDRRNKYGPKHWIPYKIYTANEGRHGHVIADSLMQRWRTVKFTFIARRNDSLMSAILDAFTVPPTPSPTQGAGSSMESSFEIQFDVDDFPKIHLDRDRENSGAKKFEKVFATIHSLLDLYLGNVSSLPAASFPDFEGREMLTWAVFCEELKENDLDFLFAHNLIVKYGAHTWEAVQFFKSQVLDKGVSAVEADIILTTCHAAKGLEWDNLQVCDDFIRPTEIVVDDRKIKAFNPATQWWEEALLPQGHVPYMMNLGWACDEINLLYVACTRAKRLLSIPAGLHDFLELFDNVYCSHKDGTHRDPANEHKYKSLVRPLRKRLGLTTTAERQLLEDSLLTSDYFQE